MQAQFEEKPTILLVDDTPGNLIALEAVLSSPEFHLISVGSGAEALKILSTQEIALVLLDIQMPGMDGFEVTKRIKTSAKTKHIPVILITAIFSEDPYIRKGYEAGAIDFFSKPLNPEVLRAKVKIYTELYRKNLFLRLRDEENSAMAQKLHSLRTELATRETEFERQKELRTVELDTVLESIPDPVYVGNENGIARCNAAALSLFGVGTKEELNQPFRTIAQRIQMRYLDTELPIPIDDQPLSHALHGKQYNRTVRVFHLASGRDLTMVCAAAPVVFENKIVGGVVVNKDVSAAENSQRL